MWKTCKNTHENNLFLKFLNFQPEEESNFNWYPLVARLTRQAKGESPKSRGDGIIICIAHDGGLCLVQVKILVYLSTENSYNNS